MVTNFHVLQFPEKLSRSDSWIDTCKNMAAHIQDIKPHIPSDNYNRKFWWMIDIALITSETHAVVWPLDGISLLPASSTFCDNTKISLSSLLYYWGTLCVSVNCIKIHIVLNPKASFTVNNWHLIQGYILYIIKEI